MLPVLPLTLARALARARDARARVAESETFRRLDAVRFDPPRLSLWSVLALVGALLVCGWQYGHHTARARDQWWRDGIARSNEAVAGIMRVGRNDADALDTRIISELRGHHARLADAERELSRLRNEAAERPPRSADLPPLGAPVFSCASAAGQPAAAATAPAGRRDAAGVVLDRAGCPLVPRRCL